MKVYTSVVSALKFEMSDLFGSSSSDSNFGSGNDTGKLQEELQQLEALTELQSQIVEFTDVCWEKCMGTPGAKLDARTETCMKNCVERFLDVTMLVTNRFVGK